MGRLDLRDPPRDEDVQQQGGKMSTQAKKWTPTSLLRAARAKMNDDGAHWTQGTPADRYYNGEYAFCLTGGITACILGDENARDYSPPKESHTAIIAAANAIREEEGRRPVGSVESAMDVLISYNDDVGRTWKDVARILGRAAARPSHYIGLSSASLRKKIGWA